MARIEVCEDHGPYVEWCDPCVSRAIAALPEDTAREFVKAVRGEVDAGRDLRASGLTESVGLN